jgi:fumarate hydratase subunit beta
MSKIRISTPFDDDTVAQLKSGDNLLINGIIYTGRDAAHKRLVDLLKNGEPLPFAISGQIIYFVGPTPARPGRPVGSAGPTTSYRMDAYSPELIAQGLKGMIGKGARSKEVLQAMHKYKCVYMAAVGGAGALISQSIKSSEVIVYEDLGPEAIRKMEVEDFPAVVVNDVSGNDLYREGVAKYRRN